MADELLGYPIEEIPDADAVYMRTHRNNLRDGKIAPGIFKAHGGGMSVNWERYCSPEVTRMQASDPSKNAVISMIVGTIRTEVGLTVRHTPILDNRAHADVILPTVAPDLTQARLELKRIAKMILPLED